MKEVHWQEHCDIFLVHEEIPHLKLHLGQVQDTPLVYRSAMAEMSLSVIGHFEIPLQHQVAFEYITIMKNHCDPQCLPQQMSNMLADSKEPTLLLKHLTLCNFPQWSSVLRILSQFSCDEHGSPSPLESEPLLSLESPSLLTTFWLWKDVQYLLSGVPHPVELHCLQCKWHAFHCSLRNTKLYQHCIVL